MRFIGKNEQDFAKLKKKSRSKIQFDQPYITGWTELKGHIGGGGGGGIFTVWTKKMKTFRRRDLNFFCIEEFYAENILMIRHIHIFFRSWCLVIVVRMCWFSYTTT